MQTISFGICVLGILFIRKAAWGYISRKFQYVLWIIAVLFLLVSPLFHISSRISVENLIVYAENAMMKKGLGSGGTEKDTPYSVPASVDAGQGMVTAEQNPILDKEIADDYETLSSVVVDADISVYSLIENYWKYVRCGVAIGISIYILLSNIFFYVSCRRNRIPYKRDEETKLNIFLLEGIGSPFLMGKDVYIDAKMTADAKRLRHMIIHEYCHYRHCDNLWVMVRNICFVLNWYNPFMWIAMDFMKRDCELACDEDVLAILDDNERKAYGYTLLEIAKHQNLQNRHFTVTTTMNGNIKKLKERITVISSEGKNNFGIVCAVAVCTMLLIVFTFTHKEESIRGSNETKETISMNVSETAEDEIEDADSLSSTNASLNNVGWNNNTSNIIYNSVKCYNNYFYYSDSEGFKRIDKGLAKIDTLAEGNVKLGNCDGDYIYYMRYPSDKTENAGVFRMNLFPVTLEEYEEEILIEWSETMWQCHNLFEYENVIYLEQNNVCDAYAIQEGKVKKLAEKDNPVYKKVDICNISYEDLNSLAPGYTNIIFQYSKCVYLDRENDKILVYDTNSGKVENIIENCGSDVMVCEKGVVYKDLNNNIFIREWKSDSSKILYEVVEHNNEIVNYGTYDDQYIYGFYEDEDKCTLVKISWEGIIEKEKVFENINRAVELNFSANNGIISFWKDGHIIFE